jgi:hypothetical protein
VERNADAIVFGVSLSPGYFASSRWNDSTTGLAAAVHTLTRLVPTTSRSVASSSGSTTSSSAAGESPRSLNTEPLQLVRDLRTH